ncbi:MAG: hypothetical protein ABSD50_14865 [Smithella sp.]
MHAIRMYIINVAVAAVMAAPTLTLADVLILTPVDVPTLIPVDALTVAVTMIKLVKMMTIKG